MALCTNPDISTGQIPGLGKTLASTRGNKQFVLRSSLQVPVLAQRSSHSPKTLFSSCRRADCVVASVSKKKQPSGFDVEKYEKDFEQRFELPHLTDIFDMKPIPSTFCIKNSCPLPEDLDDPKGDLRKMFVHNDDRVLLKVIKFATPTSAGAECVDPDCNFVHQWVHRAGPHPEFTLNLLRRKKKFSHVGGYFLV